MKPYPKYKDSGLPWVGFTPAHWEAKTIRAITKTKTEKNRPDLPLLSVYRDYGVISKDSRDDNYNRAGENLSAYKAVRPGDLVLNKMKTWQGSLGVSELAGIVSPAYITCILDQSLNRRFVHYLLRSHRYIYEYNRLSYGVRVDQWDMRYGDFKQIPLFIPSLSEQDAIVSYLDRKLEEIDRFIANKRKMIELLKEQKIAVINRAVTRGINPNARLKPSGIEWLGEIPEHWEVRRLKYLVEDVFGGSTPDSSVSRYWYGDITWVTPEDVSKTEVLTSSSRTITREGLQSCATI